MKTIATIIAIFGFVAAIAGCRNNEVTTSNYITLGTVSGSVYMADFDFGKGSNDATQAADKKVGDIAPKASVAAGPASKVTEAAGTANTVSEQPAPAIAPPVPVVAPVAPVGQ